MLKKDNWILEYRAIIEIDANAKIFNSDNEVEVLGTGIVPHISQLLFRTEYSFIQFKALSILNKMVS